MLSTSIGIEEKCKRGLFTIISLTSGNTGLPLGNRPFGNAYAGCQVLLGPALPLALGEDYRAQSQSVHCSHLLALFYEGTGEKAREEKETFPGKVSQRETPPAAQSPWQHGRLPGGLYRFFLCGRVTTPARRGAPLVDMRFPRNPGRTR